MNDSSYVTCLCRNCSENLEYEINHSGETIQCPHCGKETKLGISQTTLKSAATISKRGIENALDTAGVLICSVSCLGGLVLTVQGVQHDAATIIASGIAAAVAGVVWLLLFFAVAEIIRLLRRIN